MDTFPVLLTDAHGVVTDANSSAKEAFGACVGKRCSDIVCVRDATGRSVCEARCAEELGDTESGMRQTIGRVRAQPRRVVCAAVGDHRVVSLLPSAAPLAPRDALTPRETEVLGLVSLGLTSKRVARRLGVSFATVRTHMEHARAKLGAKTRAEAVAKASSLGLIDA